nr:uncharacterized protein LOC112039890 [Quercus suber]
METRLGGDRAKEITDRLPFDSAIHTDTIGRAGGLWLLCNSDRVEVNHLASTEQEIHAIIKVIAGDFNEPFLGEDKFGGRAVSVNNSLLFKECLDRCNMVDLGFAGPRFTWTNKREVSALIQERIDRFFVNPEWWHLFPEAHVTHLTRCHSNHCPDLLESTLRKAVHLSCPFKFQSFWLSDISVPGIVALAWRNAFHLAGAVEKFAKDATVWNKNHFGNIFEKKRRIMARLNSVQHAMADRASSHLLELEKNLQVDLDNVLCQEAELWALKSRINWAVQGDRNTSFFHMSTLVRRRRNRITTIKNIAGDWIHEDHAIMEHIQKGLAIPVSNDEIKVALWSMIAHKALGPDGLHAGFFQRFGLLLATQSLKKLKRFLKEGKALIMPSSLKNLYIPSVELKSVSEEKSRVFFLPNVDRDKRELLSDILGFRSTPSLGKYLGIPINHAGHSNQDFNFVLDRVKQKLAGWKSNLLSMASRSVLIQASSSTIPAYVMQCAQLPGKILDGIDRLNRNFLWGSTDTARKLHWMGWEKVAKPKKAGGLGLQTAKGRNTALLAKLNGRFHLSPKPTRPWFLIGSIALTEELSQEILINSLVPVFGQP